MSGTHSFIHETLDSFSTSRGDPVEFSLVLPLKQYCNKVRKEQRNRVAYFSTEHVTLWVHKCSLFTQNAPKTESKRSLLHTLNKQHLWWPVELAS